MKSRLHLVKSNVLYIAIALGLSPVLPCNLAAIRAQGLEKYPYKLRAGAATSEVTVPADLQRRVQEVDDESAKNELMINGTPQVQKREARKAGAAAPKDWRPAKCLKTLRAQINDLAKDRDRKDDGMVGDEAHWNRNSDHNPVLDIKNGVGVVTAYDITNNEKIGINVNKLVASLLAAKDARIKYIIFNGHIYNRDPIGGFPAWAKRKYSGESKHEKHVHISVLPRQNVYDSTAPWNIAIR